MAGAIQLPYGSAGWRYLYGAAGIADGFEDPAFDVSGWALGAAPFGMPGCGPGMLQTPWPSDSLGHNSDLCVRRDLGVGLREGTIRARIDDNLSVYLNGVPLFENPGTISSAYETQPITLPADALGGTNVLAIRARDRQETCAWLDLQIEALSGGWKVGVL